VVRVVDGDTIEQTDFFKFLIDEYGEYAVLEFEIDRIRGNSGRLLAYVFLDGKN
jgi:endonuclease YncB( thermonuclease family)